MVGLLETLLRLLLAFAVLTVLAAIAAFGFLAALPIVRVEAALGLALAAGRVEALLLVLVLALLPIVWIEALGLIWSTPALLLAFVAPVVLLALLEARPALPTGPSWPALPARAAGTRRDGLDRHCGLTLVLVLVAILVLAEEVAGATGTPLLLPVVGTGLLGDRHHGFGARPPAFRRLALERLFQLRLGAELIRMVYESLRPAVWSAAFGDAGRVDPDALAVATAIPAALAVHPVDLLDHDRGVGEARDAVARDAVIVDAAAAKLRTIDGGGAEEGRSKRADRQRVVGDGARGHVTRLHEHPGFGDGRLVADRRAIGIALA